MPRSWYVSFIILLGYYFPNLAGYDNKYFLLFLKGAKKVSNKFNV